MDWIIDILRDNPVIPIFLTLGVGFWLGGLRFKSFSLGPVTATLLVGVLLGQLDIPISQDIKTLAFMLFLFAIGYSVGPQFFRSLKGEGLKQIGFAVVEFIVVVAVVVVVARIFGYSKGMAVGLFSGSQTVSAVIGVGSDTIHSLGLSKEAADKMVSVIPACYAVTYVFGTIGTAWVIANFGPMMMGGLAKIKAQTKKMDEELDTGDFVPEPGQMLANRPISFRAYRCESKFFDKPRTVSDIERYLAAHHLRHFVERVRIDGEIYDPDPELRVRRGNVIVLSGRRGTMVDEGDRIGPEVTDHALLTFPSENLPVVVSKSGADGITIGELRSKPYMHGVLIHKVLRNDIPMPVKGGLKLEKGDIVTLVGLPQDVADAVPEIGYEDRPTFITDMVFIGLGIAIGCFIGAIVIKCGGIPLTLSTSGGAILAGLVMGWFRSKHPTFGQIPRSVVWFMDNAGLNLFIAVVGLQAGPTFIDGLREIGVSFFFVGILTTTLPLIISLLIGWKLFKFPPAVAMGCVAGSRNAVAALGAIQDSVDSTIPVMGYTVTYAVNSVLLIFAGIIIPLLV